MNFKRNDEIKIPIGSRTLYGQLTLPENAAGLVLFAHGSGSSRLSSRNQFVSKFLVSRRIATLLFDLLTLEEEAVDEQTRELRFDIPFLSRRLQEATAWAQENSPFSKGPIGYFGASTGAAAALCAAAALGPSIRALVSRGGRPDLAKGDLSKVSAPTLLIVGSLDTGVIELNETAFQSLRCEKKLEIVPGATHLFEESGKLERVAHLAADWFLRYLPLSSV